MITFSAKSFRNSCLSLLSLAAMGMAIAPNVAAQSQDLRLLTESNFDAPPNTSGDRQQGVSGGTRGNQCLFRTIMPPSKGEVTTLKSHPTLWVYVKPTTVQENLKIQANLYVYTQESEEQFKDNLSNPVPFSFGNLLQDHGLGQEEFRLDQPITTFDGELPADNLISLEIPEELGGLLSDTEYTWEVELACGATANLQENGGVIQKGTIYRNPLETDVESMDSQDLHSHFKARAWVDTIDALARYTPQENTNISSETKELLTEWDLLLQSIEQELQGKFRNDSSL